MSLIVAKKLADLKEQFDQLDKEVAAKFEEIRSDIRAEIKSEFISYMEAQSFLIHAAAGLISASYKDLTVVLIFSSEPMMGSFDYLNVLVDGKPRDIFVVAEFSGIDRPSLLEDPDPVRSLEMKIDSLKAAKQNMSLDSYSFIYAPAGSRHPAATLVELLDMVLAVK